MRAWEDDSLSDLERAVALIESARHRPRLKRLGRWLDEQEGDELRQAVVAVAKEKGIQLEPEAIHWPGKRLLRRVQGRETAARERSNPIVRDEGFVCAACGASVSAHGRTARDHCPECLCSLHVDVVPGDRAARCGALLRATGLEMRGGQVILRYQCDGCGERRVNRALLDGESPDSWSVISALSAKSLG